MPTRARERWPAAATSTNTMLPGVESLRRLWPVCRVPGHRSRDPVRDLFLLIVPVQVPGRLREGLVGATPQNDAPLLLGHRLVRWVRTNSRRSDGSMSRSVGAVNGESHPHGAAAAGSSEAQGLSWCSSMESAATSPPRAARHHRRGRRGPLQGDRRHRAGTPRVPDGLQLGVALPRPSAAPTRVTAIVTGWVYP